MSSVYHQTANPLADLSLTGNEILRFTNCHILRDESLIEDDLWIQNGVILNGLEMFFTKKLTADITIDVDGAVISPGFIDIQVNGAFGCDFSDVLSDSVKICRYISSKFPQMGVTAFCPTIITSPKDVYHQILSRFHNYTDTPGCARMLGLHLEGPFINAQCAGMHPKAHIRDLGSDPVESLTDTYGPYENVTRIVTIAPELDGCMDAISALDSQGIIVSIGHTDADCSTLQHAVLAGASFMTHLFNAMPVFHHRRSHLLGAIVTSTPDLHVGLIADRMHVHPAAMRVAEAIAPSHVVLVTDSNTAFGLSDGTYNFGAQAIEVTNGLAYLSGTDCLAGGTTPLASCIGNFWLDVSQYTNRCKETSDKWNGLGSALAAASTRPARVLRLFQNQSTNDGPGLSNGSLEPGANADIVILCPISLSHPKSPHLKILSTWIDGKPVYNSTNANFEIKYKTG